MHDSRIRAELTVGKDYDVIYRDGTNSSHSEKGELISLDEQGFVVIKDKNGQRVIIKKDLVEIMRELVEGESSAR